MVDNSNEYWLAYLTNSVVVKCLQLSKERCPGCKERMTSPLLHYHLQLSLLDKMKCYFEEVRGPMIKDIEECFQSFASQISLNDDGTNFHFLGQTFMMMATAESLYYGRYLDDNNDARLFPRPIPEPLKIFNGTLKRPSSPKLKEAKKKKILAKKKPDVMYNFYSDYE